VDPFSVGVYHAVNGGTTNWQDFTAYLFNILRTKVKVTGSERNDPLRPKYGVLSNSRLPRPRHWAMALEEYIRNGELAEARR